MRTAQKLVVACVLLAVASAACGDDKPKAQQSTTSRPGGSTTAAPTSTTATPGPTAILTGLAADAAAATRPAVTVKVENTRAARPQTGLEFADIIYEEVVEGGITRLAAIYQSRVPDVVGPVRSVRKTDQAIVRPLQGIFVYSGGAPYAEQSIATAPVIRLNESKAGNAMFRDRNRRAPHNLYMRGADVYAKAPDAKGPPPSLFTYSAVPSVAGVAASHVVVGFRGDYAVVWDWDPAAQRWQRSIFGRKDMSAAGVQLGATNVVIQQVNYVGGVRSGPKQGFGAEAQLTGTGKGWVLTNGRAIAATWKRASPSEPGEWVDADGVTIALAPGTTWVELPEPSYPISIR